MALLLGRKFGEALAIDVPHPDGTQTRVWVEYRGGTDARGRIAVHAPREVVVSREELLPPAERRGPAPTYNPARGDLP
jgi:sRNA-binding carbon storage regulator CsrA